MRTPGRRRLEALKGHRFYSAQGEYDEEDSEEKNKSLVLEAFDTRQVSGFTVRISPDKSACRK